MVLLNDTKHDRFCKWITEIKEHAKNFPNAPRTYAAGIISRHFYYKKRWNDKSKAFIIFHTLYRQSVKALVIVLIIRQSNPTA